MDKKDKSLEEFIPEEYHEYLNVFDKGTSDCFPISRPWDHKIKLKEGFEPKSFKIYPFTSKEQPKHFSKKFYGKDIFDPLNLLWPLHFSMSIRKMQNYDHVKTINT